MSIKTVTTKAQSQTGEAFTTVTVKMARWINTSESQRYSTWRKLPAPNNRFKCRNKGCFNDFSANLGLTINYDHKKQSKKKRTNRIILKEIDRPVPSISMIINGVVYSMKGVNHRLVHSITYNL